MSMGFVWRVGDIGHYSKLYAPICFLQTIFSPPFICWWSLLCALLSHLLWPCFVRISEGCLYRCLFLHHSGTHSTNKWRHNISDFVAFHSHLSFFPLLFISSSFFLPRNVSKCVYIYNLNHTLQKSTKFLINPKIWWTFFNVVTTIQSSRSHPLAFPYFMINFLGLVSIVVRTKFVEINTIE